MKANRVYVGYNSAGYWACRDFISSKFHAGANEVYVQRDNNYGYKWDKWSDIGYGYFSTFEGLVEALRSLGCEHAQPYFSSNKDNIQKLLDAHGITPEPETPEPPQAKTSKPQATSLEVTFDQFSIGNKVRVGILGVGTVVGYGVDEDNDPVYLVRLEDTLSSGKYPYLGWANVFICPKGLEKA